MSERKRRPGRVIPISEAGMPPMLVRDEDGQTTLTQDQVDALRDHFLAERDASLGRWRDSVDPNLVAYPGENPAGDSHVTIINEATGERWGVFYRHLAPYYLKAPGDEAPYAQCSDRFFEANPAPAPAWRDAKFITWRTTAHLPAVAVRDPHDKGGRDLGWSAPDNDGTDRWYTEAQLVRHIGDATVTILRETSA